MDEKTTLCVSIAEKPGTFGAKFHNEGYKLLGLNFAYLPLKVNSSQLESVITLVRGNFHGCSVSMPHKLKVVDYLDSLDESALRVGAVNTVLKKEDGTLHGYNTDYYGAKAAMEKSLGSIAGKKVLLLGSGGVARAISHAVKDLGGKLAITNRTEEKAEGLAEKVGAEHLPWKERNNCSGFLLINATGVGMDHPGEMAVSEEAIDNFEAVMDVVIKNTALIEAAKFKGKKTIPGTMLTAYQAARQFEIYTGKKLPEEFVKKFYVLETGGSGEK